MYDRMGLDCKTEPKDVKKAERCLKVKLSDKLKNVSEKLYETTVAFGEAKILINDEIFMNISPEPPGKANHPGEVEKNRQKLMVRLQKLKEDNDVKDKELSRMSKKIRELNREREYDGMKINKQRKQLQEWKSKIENITLIENGYEQFKKERDSFCLQDKLKHVCETK